MNLESGPHASSSTHQSKFGSTSRICFVALSYTTSRNRSLSYPARCCIRHAMYFPSGEYRGVKSPPGLVEIFTGFAFGSSSRSVKISTFVLSAGSSTFFSSNAISFPSGEKSHPSGSPSENGGTSCVSPGFRSRNVPSSTESKNKCVLLSSVNAFQCRYRRCVKICAFTFDCFCSSSRLLSHTSSSSPFWPLLLQSGYTDD